MRIVSGKHKGRPIKAPPTQATRPTSDRARESLFNIISHAAWAPPLTDARIIDLFAGSGALGLEALSRGAAFCVFVETAAAARSAIRENIAGLGLHDATQIHRRSAVALGTKPINLEAPFSMAFLDPPYHKNLVPPALTALQAGGWLTPAALIIAETSIEEALEIPDWACLATRDVGAAKFWFLQAETR